MGIGTKLIALRTERGIIQKELAAYLRVSVGTISNYEQDLHAPDLATLTKIADFYDVSTDYLLGRTDYRYHLDTLNAPLIRSYNCSQLLNIVRQLPTGDQQSLAEYLDFLRRKNSVSARISHR